MKHLRHFLSWLGRKFRGPFHFVFNILKAALEMDLRDYADRKGQTPVKRVAYRIVLSVEAVLKAAFMAILLIVIGATAAVVLPVFMLAMDLYNLWRK